MVGLVAPDVILNVGVELDPAAEATINAGIKRVASKVRALDIRIDPTLDAGAVQKKIREAIKSEGAKVFIDLDFNSEAGKKLFKRMTDEVGDPVTKKLEKEHQAYMKILEKQNKERERARLERQQTLGDLDANKKASILKSAGEESQYNNRRELQNRKDEIKKFNSELATFARDEDRAYKNTVRNIGRVQGRIEDAESAAEGQDFRGSLAKAAQRARQRLKDELVGGGGKMSNDIAASINDDIDRAFQHVSRNASQVRRRAFGAFGAGQVLQQLGFPVLGNAANAAGGSILAFGNIIGASAATAAGVALGGLVVLKGAIEQLSKISGEAAKFETAQARITALTGASPDGAENLAQLSKSLAQSRLTGGAGNATQILEGAYFITSSGFKDMSAAQEVLKASAMGATAGLGDVKTVADAVTSVMNAYGHETYSAGEVTDKFVAIVREGKSEPQQLAKSLGLVLPIASAAGVSLNDLGAALAVITQTGSSTPQAVTQVKQAIASLFDPTKEGITQLQLLGLEVVDIRKKMREEGGFQSVLKDIVDRSGNDEAVLSNIFGNIRALTGVLSVARGDFNSYNQVLGSVRGSMGETARAAEVMAGTIEQTAARVDNSIKNISTSMGATLNRSVVLPVLEKSEYALKFATGTAEAEDRLAAEKRGIQDAINLYQSQDEIKSRILDAMGGRDIEGDADKKKSTFLRSGTRSLLGAYFGDDQKRIGELRAEIAGIEAQQTIYTAAYQKSSRQLVDSLNSIDKEASFLIKTRQDSLPDLGNKGKKVLTSSDADDLAAALKKANDARKKEIDQSAKMNADFANGLASGIDALIGSTNKYDDFFKKYEDVTKKIAETSPTLSTFVNTSGEAVTMKKLASERVRLEKNIRSGETQERLAIIREQQEDLRKEGAKSPRAKQIAELSDQASDIRRDENLRKLNEAKTKLGDINKGIGVNVSKNPEYLKLLEEQKKLLEQYDEGTFATAVNSFQAALISTSGDQKTFAELLKSGGAAISLLADQAGLFKSTGFVTALGEAGLQMNYLRDQSGKWLEGSRLTAGFAKYTEELNKFKTAMLELQPFLSGEQKITKDNIGLTGLDFGFERRAETRGERERGDGGGAKAQATKQFFGDYLESLQDPKGIQDAILRKFGIDSDKAIEAQIKIQAKLTFGDNKSARDAVAELKKEAESQESIAIKIALQYDENAVKNMFNTDAFKKELDGVDTSEFLNKLKEVGIAVSNPKIKVESDVQSTVTDDIRALEGLGREVASPKAKLDSDIVISVARDQASINSLTGKIVYIDVVTRYSVEGVEEGDDGTNGGTPGKPNGKPKLPFNPLNTYLPPKGNKASGGRVDSSGYYTVGELGPERVYLKQGQFVLPANSLSRLTTSRPDGVSGGFASPQSIVNNSVTYVNSESFSIDARGAGSPKSVRDSARRGIEQGMSKSAQRREQAAVARSRGGR